MSAITNINDACVKLYNARPDWKIIKGLNYRDYFVFDAVPKDHDLEKDGPCIIGLTCVRKSDGKVFGFHPMINDPDSFFEEWHKYSVKNLPSIEEVSNGRNPK